MNGLFFHGLAVLLAVTATALCGCRHWTEPSDRASQTDRPGTTSSVPSQEASSPGLVCRISCESATLKPGEVLVLTVQVENAGEVPVDVDIRGLSWDDIAEIEQRITDAQRRIDDPAIGNSDAGKRIRDQLVELRDEIVELLDRIRERGGPRVMGAFHITDLRTKKTHTVGKTTLFCGTGRQFAPMPPGTSVSRRFEFGPAELLREGKAGDVEIVFHVLGRVDGERETIAVSNRLRICVLAAEGQGAKRRGTTQPSAPAGAAAAEP